MEEDLAHLIHMVNILLSENCHDDIRVEALKEIREILEERQSKVAP